MVNAIAFAQPFFVYVKPDASSIPLSHQDMYVWWLIETFFKDKFITAFTLLFGISVFLVGRDSGPDADFSQTPLFRRLTWLAVFGLLHGALIWHGDILLQYAVTALVFFWRWRRTDARLLLVLGLALFVIGAAVQLVPMVWASYHPSDLSNQGDLTAVVHAMRGSFWDSLFENATVWFQGEAPEIINYLPTTLGLMMMGLALFHSGLLRGTSALSTYVWWLVTAALSLIVIGWQAWQAMEAQFPFPQILGIYNIANTLLCLPVALGYASALILMGRTRLGRWLLYPLACTGRMAFTNYLCQSFIMTSIFYGGREIYPGLVGHFGDRNHAALVPLVVGIGLAQLITSTIWMTLFRYGPLEWGWRCLTYQRWVSLLKNRQSLGSLGQGPSH